MSRVFASSAERTVPVHIYTSTNWEAEKDKLDTQVRTYAETMAFDGGGEKTLIVPNTEGRIGAVLFGLKVPFDGRSLAGLSSKLPAGNYEIAQKPDALPTSWIASGWADGAYRFDRYLSKVAEPPCLVLPKSLEAEQVRRADATSLLRDLVNTPAQDMKPSDIEAVLCSVADKYGAKIDVVQGDELLDANYPLVHAVGRAAGDAPRFIELSWGDQTKPHIALVGKGVAFDTGGLNLKPANGMRHMKKDMGGAAHAAALAQLVMEANLPVYLKLYIPTVENAVSRLSFRPGDVLNSRKGLTVEIDNTDAEGRLILADALTRACEAKPDLLIDFATLTGAARIALGQDLAPFYTDDETLADDLLKGAKAAGDACWRMPLWDPYYSDLKSSIADIVNAGGSLGGSITAALFLKKFVDAPSWVHFDVWAWRKAAYGRPAGAAACGLHAVWTMLQARFG